MDTAAYTYFSFEPNLQSGDPVTFVLTRLSGDPDLCINAGTIKPTIYQNDYRETAYGNDVITITAVTSQVFTVAVFGSGTSSFTLLAVQNDSLTLVDGVPQVRMRGCGHAPPRHSPALGSERST